MKKTMIQLAVTGMVLACATAAFAATKLPSSTTQLVDCNNSLSWYEGGIHAKATGTVTIQTTRDGGADVTVQLRNGAKCYTYVVRSHGQVLGTFTTNVGGNGGGTFHVAKVTDLSQWVAVWETVLHFLWNPDGTPVLNADGSQKWDLNGQLLCAWNPFFVP